VRRDVITLRPGSGGEGWEGAIGSLAAFESKIGERAVLIGDLDDTTDQTCPTPSMRPVSGVLIHACALATLNRGMVFRISDTLSWGTVLWGLLLVLAVIVGVRLLYSRSRRLQQWPFQYIEILSFAAMSAGAFLVFGWHASARGVAWPHVLWLCGALFLHPFVSEPLFRAAVGMPRALRAAAPSRAGRAKGA
jgi:CHASE2 domain-containing sensor protein